jgi:hypothetical protein
MILSMVTVSMSGLTEQSTKEIGNRENALVTANVTTLMADHTKVSSSIILSMAEEYSSTRILANM